jgi:hypothetical protein
VAQDQGEKAGINTTKLKQQAKQLAKEKAGAHTLVNTSTIGARKLARQEQAQNYDINQKKLARYLN